MKTGEQFELGGRQWRVMDYGMLVEYSVRVPRGGWFSVYEHEPMHSIETWFSRNSENGCMVVRKWPRLLASSLVAVLLVDVAGVAEEATDNTEWGEFGL